MGYGFTKRFSCSALCLVRRIHAHVTVHRAFPNFTFFLRENGPGTFIRAFTSHPSVTCSESASPEEYKKFRCSGFWLHVKIFVFSAMLGPTDTRSSVSLWRLSRISHIFYVKMDSRRQSWTLFYVRLVSGSHVSVSVSPEEYRISGFLGDHFSAICVFDANAGLGHLRELRRLFGCISHCFLREGEPRILCWITPSPYSVCLVQQPIHIMHGGFQVLSRWRRAGKHA